MTLALVVLVYLLGVLVYAHENISDWKDFIIALLFTIVALIMVLVLGKQVL